MRYMVCGVLVDQKLYEEYHKKKYRVHYGNTGETSLMGIEFIATSQEYQREFPEVHQEAEAIYDTIAEEIRQHYLEKDGRKSYMAIRHTDFVGYFEDFRKVYGDILKKREAIQIAIENARNDWEAERSAANKGEAWLTSRKAEYLEAEEKYKNSIDELQVELKVAIDSIQSELQKHLNDFYTPNGNRIDEATKNLLDMNFPFTKSEFDVLIGEFTANPTMLRLLEQYAKSNNLRSDLMVRLGHYARSGGSEEGKIFSDLSVLAQNIISPTGSKLNRVIFDKDVDNAIKKLQNIPVRPMTE